jgi:hypothetical protein
MENEARMEANEVDLGFCLFDVFYIIYPWGFIDQLQVHGLQKKSAKINKMFVPKVETFI